MEEPEVASQNTTPDLLTQARTVLEENDRGSYTVPSVHLYPHQWFWDSCFISIGQRHYDVNRAQSEILSLLQGQWTNGMLPNIIFNSDPGYRRDREFWQSKISPYSPDHLATSGITQPPMLAEAIVRIGEKLTLVERRGWYKMVYPSLLAYHEWLYKERDPHQEGLVIQIHPWEIGTDNTPPWMSSMHQHLMPWWIRGIEKLHIDWFVNLLRRDTRFVPADQRFSTVESLVLFDAQRRLRRKAYNIDKILDRSLFTIEDLLFNSILIRANELLQKIARTIDEKLPADLIKQIGLTVDQLENLYDPYAGEYFSRDFITHHLIKEPSIAALMPLYAGCISKERAAQLVKMLHNKHLFGTTYPVPSVPVNSAWFSPKTYWQGPTWINTNWLIIDGLKRYGYHDEAEALVKKSVDVIELSGLSEYFDPLTGEAEGIDNFSWTAALYIDLKQSTHKKKK